MKKILFLFIVGFFVCFAFSSALAQKDPIATSGDKPVVNKLQPAESQLTGFESREILIRSKNESYPYVYVVRNGVKAHVKSIEELRQYYAGKPILNVSEETLQKYNGKIIDGKAYKEGSLVRDLTRTIYSVGDNILKRVASITDLATFFAGKKINNIAAVIENKEFTNKEMSYTFSYPGNWSAAMNKENAKYVYFGEKADEASGEGQIVMFVPEATDSKALATQGKTYWLEAGKKDFSMFDMTTYKTGSYEITHGKYKYDNNGEIWLGSIAFFVDPLTMNGYSLILETEDKAKLEMFNKMVESFTFIKAEAVAEQQASPVK